jgi:hypothetical protein
MRPATIQNRRGKAIHTTICPWLLCPQAGDSASLRESVFIHGLAEAEFSHGRLRVALLRPG